MKDIYLLDASGFLFRAYHAIQGMSTKQGEATNALFGFIRSYLKLQEAFHPTHIVAVFDGKSSKQARLALYPAYKAHRDAAPPDLINQIIETQRFCDLMGIPQLAHEGVEADDTIATLAGYARDHKMRTFICTGDKDLAQLVDDTTTIINPHKDNLRVDAAKVEELYGVPPHQVQDYLSLIGDASDNIPGVSGVGPKTAIALLKEYHSLDGIYNHLAALTPKQRALLERDKDNAYLSQKLVALNTNVPCAHEFELRAPDYEGLKAFFHDKGFTSLLKLLPASKPVATMQYHTVTTQEALHALVEKLKGAEEICFDTETTSIQPLQATLVGIGIGCDANNAYYIPRSDEALKALKPILEAKPIYGHNIKYDLHIMANEGIALNHICFDTMIASYLLNAEQRRHSLDELSLAYFGVAKTATSDLLGRGKKQLTMDQLPVERVAAYCCEDVEYTFRLKQRLAADLAQRNLMTLLTTLELPLVPILASMERHGMYVDQAALKELSHTLSTALATLQEQIYGHAGEAFTINSPKQLAEILYTKLKLQPLKKSLSTDAEALTALSPHHPIAALLLEYRSLSKLLSTYVDTLPLTINPATHRIHCTFNQSVAATGRLSCQDPNLQNIPVRTPIGRQIRRAFRPEKQGWSYLSADYSQIELRIMAHLSHDPGLLDAFKHNLDVHAATASQVFGVPLDQVTDEMRRKAKVVNFALLYGQGAYGLSLELGCTTQEAARFIDLYFNHYPGVRAYLQRSTQQARDTGRAVTLTGRERLLPEINSTNQMLRSAAERLAINTPLQGLAADLIKRAMSAIDAALKKHHLKSYMVLQIHDELLFEALNEELPELQRIVQHEMEHAMALDVPLLVQIAIGKNWEECYN